MRSIWSLALVGVLLLTAAPRTARACSCPVQPGVVDYTREQLENAPELFRGTVVSVFDPFDGRCDPAETPWSRVAMIEVSWVWRGEVGSQVLVESSLDSCGHSLEVGEEAIFSIRPTDDGTRSVYTCRPPLSLRVVDNYPDLFGGGAPPPPADVSLPDCPVLSTGEAATGCAAAPPIPAVAALLAALAFRRRRRRDR